MRKGWALTDLEGHCFSKKNGGLWPTDIAADDLMASLQEGNEVLVTIRRPRSLANHRHMFAILQKTLHHLPERIHITTLSGLLDAIKLAVGHTKTVQTLQGDVYKIPASIDFASMDEIKFKRFKDRALWVLGQVIGCDPSELDATPRVYDQNKEGRSGTIRRPMRSNASKRE